MRSGCAGDSIYRVLLVSGRFSVSKTIIPEARKEQPCTVRLRAAQVIAYPRVGFLHYPRSQEHFRDTHPFGGLGLRDH